MAGLAPLGSLSSTMSSIRADLLLLLAALIWGTALIAQKQANDSMGPISFVGARFLLSWLAVSPLALREHLRGDAAPLRQGDMSLAFLIGLCLFLGASLQQVALVTTTATNGGFLTALYVIFVPLIVWAVTGKRPQPVILIASLLCIAGSWLLMGDGPFQRLSRGDALILVADIAWAGAIALAPIFLSRTRRPFLLAAAQYAVVALLGVTGGFGLETFSMEGLISALPAILYAGLVSGAVAFTLQLVAQSHTPAARAALIMSLESVVAALAGAALLSERITAAAILGCVLIVTGVVVGEAGPAARNARLLLARRHRIG